MSINKRPAPKSLLLIGAASLILAGCAGAPLGLDLGQKPMAGTWKGTYLCPNIRLTRQDIVMTLQDGRIPGSFNGVIEMNYIYSGKHGYLKYSVVGSNVGGHVEIKGKQVLARDYSGIEMGPMFGNMPDSDTINAEACGRLHPMKRVSGAQQTVQR